MDSLKLFKQVTDAITTIILYVLLLALIVGMAKTLLGFALLSLSL
ncbi:MAG: hypothetical protein WC183_05065 [Methanosarcina sp.]